MATKSEMESVLREEGWKRDSCESVLWWDTINSGGEFERGFLRLDAYRIAMRRKQARERWLLKSRDWICINRWWSKYSGYAREDGSKIQERVHYTREDAIKWERRLCKKNFCLSTYIKLPKNQE